MTTPGALAAALAVPAVAPLFLGRKHSLPRHGLAAVMVDTMHRVHYTVVAVGIFLMV